MVPKRQHAKSTFLWTASQTVHSRRHASQLPSESSNEEKPKANVDAASSRKTRRLLGSDESHPLRTAEDVSNGISKRRVLFSQFGIWFSDKEGGGTLDSRRKVL